MERDSRHFPSPSFFFSFPPCDWPTLGGGGTSEGMVYGCGPPNCVSEQTVEAWRQHEQFPLNSEIRLGLCSRSRPGRTRPPSRAESSPAARDPSPGQYGGMYVPSQQLLAIHSLIFGSRSGRPRDREPDPETPRKSRFWPPRAISTLSQPGNQGRSRWASSVGRWCSNYRAARQGMKIALKKRPEEIPMSPPNRPRPCACSFCWRFCF